MPTETYRPIDEWIATLDGQDTRDFNDLRDLRHSVKTAGGPAYARGVYAAFLTKLATFAAAHQAVPVEETPKATSYPGFAPPELMTLSAFLWAAAILKLLGASTTPATTQAVVAATG